ncbi:hypothetical protein BDY17DRAFT_117058 [Neohortaea acidophila]|uniref:C6 finger domain protein n=1 Tax=Neohortaea acidophila TaxID=245834 RepID=A0A6A6PX67_9PEZI|nr:uncharacterized protein BDY17DRAFT_117058 [Neohortaea acidophila]KAF2483867.1 hypothetical protein BDY17DRAFT_117058 [Neohortaea acidophila]
MQHAALLTHVMTDPTLFELGDGIGEHFSNISFLLNEAQKAPFLMYQLLAFSARHLAFLHPESATSHLQQAVRLQTHGLALFNTATAAGYPVNEADATSILLFSVILGHHVLTDTLSARNYDGWGAFATSFGRCTSIQRGIPAVARSAWPSLLQTELHPILSGSSTIHSRAPQGSQCQAVLRWIESSPLSDEGQKEIYRVVLRYLQLGYDLLEDNGPVGGNKFRMVFSWPHLVPAEFSRWLEEGKPEALVIFIYYAVLLKRAKTLWPIQDAGDYNLDLAKDGLEPQWHYWIEAANGIQV